MKIVSIALFVIAFLLWPTNGFSACPECWIPSAALVAIGVWAWRQP